MATVYDLRNGPSAFVDLGSMNRKSATVRMSIPALSLCDFYLTQTRLFSVLLSVLRQKEL